MSYKWFGSSVLILVLLASCTVLGGGKTPVGTPPPQDTVVVQASPTTPEDIQSDATKPSASTSTLASTATSLAVEPTLPPEWYTIQPGTPLATFNTPHAAAGCYWLGVGGQVFGPDSAPELGVSILVGGTLDGYQVGSLGTTGMETNIGEGGYEVTLADHPVDSSGTLWIQVVDSIGKPLSAKIYFNTFNDCQRNFILINFVNSANPFPREVGNTYIPFLFKQSGVVSTPVP